MKNLLKAIVLFCSMIGASVHGFDCPATTVSEANLIQPWDKADTQSNWTNDYGWYGTEDLAALMAKNGKWVGMGAERDYFDKFWWWYKGFDASKPGKLKLTIKATRLDEESEPVIIDNPTSGYNSSGWNAILVGMTFPSPGCWEVVGSLGDRQLAIIFEVE